MLQATFFALLNNYTTSLKEVEMCWKEIEQHYSEKGRHYHTLAHLQSLLNELTEVKPFVGNWDVILFTLYYHDIIYNPLRNNNEEESAVLAQKRMKQLGIPDADIEKCTAQILATKHHTESDNDTNFFTDADLAVLGSEETAYARYSAKIRKEYHIYPDIIYNPGRKKVLQHFLDMKYIYKTGYFRQKFELQARRNLQQELAKL